MAYDDTDRTCEECGRWIERNELLFRVRLEIFAEPTIHPEPAPGKERLAADWNALIARMERMSDEQVQEAADQVHELLEYNLCRECRRELHRRIRLRRDLSRDAEP
jgi:hypothetical protein